MRVLVVYAHPVVSSYNAALHQRALAALKRAGHEIGHRDGQEDTGGLSGVSNQRNAASSKTGRVRSGARHARRGEQRGQEAIFLV